MNTTVQTVASTTHLKRSRAKAVPSQEVALQQPGDEVTLSSEKSGKAEKSGKTKGKGKLGRLIKGVVRTGLHTVLAVATCLMTPPAAGAAASVIGRAFIDGILGDEKSERSEIDQKKAPAPSVPTEHQGYLIS